MVRLQWNQSIAIEREDAKKKKKRSSGTEATTPTTAYVCLGKYHFCEVKRKNKQRKNFNAKIVNFACTSTMK